MRVPTFGISTIIARLAVVFFLVHDLTLSFAGPVHETIADFARGPETPDEGNVPVRAPDGFYYGTTTKGGKANAGTLYRLSASGEFTLLIEFSGEGTVNRGALPVGRLTPGGDGYLYGVTRKGGNNDLGTVFRYALPVDPNQPGTIESLFDAFPAIAGNGAIHFASPVGTLVKGLDGAFYGASGHFESSLTSRLFRIIPPTQPGGAWKREILIAMTGDQGAYPGFRPSGGMVLAGDGNFYGTTTRGGIGGLGVIYRLRPPTPPATAWGYDVVGQFRGEGAGYVTTPNVYGADPVGELAIGADGQLYGATSSRSVFKVALNGTVTTILAVFFPENPRVPSYGSLALDASACLWGTDHRGIIRLAPPVAPGDPWTSTLVYEPLNGRLRSGLALFEGDYLLGATTEGGPGRVGTVFKVNADGQFANIVEFGKEGGAIEGVSPSGGVLLSDDGYYYGTTERGGIHGYGTVYRVRPGEPREILVSFSGVSGPVPGSTPIGLTRLDDGTFLGTASAGGASNLGIIYQLIPPEVPAGDWSSQTLCEFTGVTGSTLGSKPNGPLVSGPDGAYYGTTVQGGIHDEGTIFKIVPPIDPGGQWTFVSRYTFTSFGSEGRRPKAGLTMSSDGWLYGSAGALFRLQPTGQIQQIGNDGVNAEAPVAIDSSGALFGVRGLGDLFRYHPSGGFAVVATLPRAGTSILQVNSKFIIAPDGALIGVTANGGGLLNGSIFKATPPSGGAGDWTISTLLDFTGNGSQPGSGSSPSRSEPFLGLDGHLYGTTQAGGPRAGGTVWRLHFGAEAVTVGADQITFNAARLRAAVNPRGAATQVVFEWGTSRENLSQTTSVSLVGDGVDAVPVSATLPGLLPGTVYFFRVRADNAEQYQPQRGQILSFTTAPNHAPTLDLLGSNPAVVELGSSYAEAGANGSDEEEGILPVQILGQVNPMALGSYTLSYQVTDSAGATAGATRTVQVVDTTVPVFGDPPTTGPVVLGSLVSDFRAAVAVSDNDLASLTISQTPSAGTPLARVGSHQVTLTARDGSGNVATLNLTLAVVAQRLEAGGNVPGMGQQFLSFGIPAINDDGALAFVAKVSDGTSRIFAGAPVASVAQSGEEIQGLAGVRFRRFTDPVIAHDGSVAFIATLAGQGINESNDEALFAKAGGALSMIAREGQTYSPVPGTRWRKLKSFLLTVTPGNVPTVVFTGQLIGQVSEGNDTLIVAWNASSGLRTLFRKGDEVSGVRVKGWRALDVVAGSAGHGRGVAGDDVSVLLLDRDLKPMHGVSGLVGDAAPAVGHRVGQPVTVPSLQVGGVWRNLGPTSPVAASDPIGDHWAAFAGSLKPTNGESSISGLFFGRTTDAEEAEIIAQAGNEVASLPGLRWQSFRDPVAASGPDEQSISVGFHARLQGIGVNESNRAAVGIANFHVAEPADVLLRQGTLAPGTEVGRGLARFDSFSSIALPSWGENSPLLVVARLRSGSRASPGPGGTHDGNDLGLWAVRRGDPAELIVREGQTLPNGGGTKKVKSFTCLSAVPRSPAATRSFNRQDTIVFRATFDDGTQAIITRTLTSDVFVE